MYINMNTALEIGAQLSTILGFTYGLFWLERYRKQKIVEHQSDDAKKGLELLVLIEESLDTLYLGTEDEQKNTLLKTLPKALREMYNVLLLLKELPGISVKLQLIERLYDTLISTKTELHVSKTMIDQIFAQSGGYKHEFKDLKGYLIRIYILRA